MALCAPLTKEKITLEKDLGAAVPAQNVRRRSRRCRRFQWRRIVNHCRRASRSLKVAAATTIATLVEHYLSIVDCRALHLEIKRALLACQALVLAPCPYEHLEQCCAKALIVPRFIGRSH